MDKLLAPCLYIVHTFLPPKKGQPLNNGQNTRPQSVHYSEVPLYILAHRVARGVGCVAWSESHVTVLEPNLRGIRCVVEDNVGVNEKVRGQSAATRNGDCGMRNKH